MNNLIVNFYNQNSSNEINFLTCVSNQLGLEPYIVIVSKEEKNLKLISNSNVKFLLVDDLDYINKEDLANAILDGYTAIDFISMIANDYNNEILNLLSIKANKDILLNAKDIRIEDSKILLTRQIYSNYLYREYDVTNGIAYSISINNKIQIDEDKLNILTKHDVKHVNIACKHRFIAIEHTKKEANKLKEAKRVLLIGRGVRREDIPNVELIAKELNAEIGATRPVTQLGIIPINKMVGTSNISVSPNVLIALGVSGSAPLLAGIDKSKKIIAINNDKSAMIFKHSDIGVLIDSKDFIKETLNQLEGKND